MDGKLTIGELTRELGLTPRTLRFWEDQGLIAPQRIGTRRLYGPRERTRAILVLRGQRLGFSLAEIRQIIGLYDRPPEQGGGEGKQLELLLEKIALRQAELLQKRADIEATLKELAEVAAGCHGRLEQLGRKARRA
jgi:DNA-binding transcriptional MerR regulator